MSIAAISNAEDHQVTVPAPAKLVAMQVVQQQQQQQQPLPFSPVLAPLNDNWMADMAGISGLNAEICLPGCGRIDTSTLCTDLCAQPVSGVEQFSLA